MFEKIPRKTVHIFLQNGSKCCINVIEPEWHANLTEVGTKQILKNNMRSFNIRQTIKQRWSEAKAKLKKRYAMLTDDDLVLRTGKETELIGRLQNKLGVQKDEVMKILAEL